VPPEGKKKKIKVYQNDPPLLYFYLSAI